jgi:hypothetical protein
MRLEDSLRRVSPPGQRAFQFSLSQSRPAPLWQQARVEADRFRSADLKRTHWKKVWHSMFEV